jgi:hypothetical protein
MQRTLISLFHQSIRESHIEVALEEKGDTFILTKISRAESEQNL